MKPDFYVTRLDELDAFLSTLKTGEVREFGRSAGGRPLQAVTYGEKEEITRLAPLSAAIESTKPETFYGETTRQVLMIVSTIHGGEMESIAGVCNLMSVLETGRDLKGKTWPDLRRDAAKLRLVVVGCANPDGRAHIPDDKDDPTTWTEEEVHAYRHGRYTGGEPATWPRCKAPLPASEDDYEYFGGYMNDAHVVPDHGYFLGPEYSPEAHALIQLALDEHVHCVLDCHSCESGPFMICGRDVLPKPLVEAQFRADGAFRQKLRERALGAKPWTVTGHTQTLSLRELYWFIAGAQTHTFEAPNGMFPGNTWKHDQIVDMYLTLFEVFGSIGANENFRVVRRP
ncbi:MAG TPA: M14 family zinc carboxypeptidase [Planctomycetota bacterium]|nr:M14 family zinc carboxypeptidase [Planctomycetota bacterium]